MIGVFIGGIDIMASDKITAGLAALKVMEGWGVDTMYGIPSGTLSGLMDAMGHPGHHIQFIQVKHEETGAMAAEMQWKWGGKLGVAVGSGGPGATHLINGIYDAAMDRIPMLAILGSKPNRENAMDAFQELNQNPMYENVAVYNRRVAYAEELPKLVDAGLSVTALLEKTTAIEQSAWWDANLENVKNWREYMDHLEKKTQEDLQFYQVYHAINTFADNDAIFSIDVGNVTLTSTRHLHMTEKNMWRTSPLFASMGIAIPGGIAAKKTYPNRQVWNIIGDGAFAMTYPDVVTNVHYQLPVINVVFTNTEYGFIKNKYEDTNTYNFGVDFDDVDYAKIAEAQGAVGLTVSKIEDINRVVKEAVEHYRHGRVVVIDAKITHDRPLPVETLKLDPSLYSEAEVLAYKEKYEAQNLVPFREILEQHHLSSQYIKDEENQYSF